ncbi:ogr/Delta-like zinc finger family protein, partial [Yersinia sp. 1252 StPb PI]
MKKAPRLRLKPPIPSTLTGNTKENYHQCQNLLCSCTFTTLQSVDKILSRP